MYMKDSIGVKDGHGSASRRCGTDRRPKPTKGKAMTVDAALKEARHQASGFAAFNTRNRKFYGERP